MPVKINTNDLKITFQMKNLPKTLLNPYKFKLKNKLELQKIDRYRMEISLLCDLKCEYCVVHMNKIEQQNTLMNIETAKKIIERYNNEVGENGSVFLMGGEPLLNRKVLKYIILNAKGKSMVFTNGLSLDDELIEFFLTHKTRLFISLDGSTLEDNKRRFQPNIEKNFNIVVGNIKKVVSKGIDVSVSCLLHEGNYKNAEEIAEYFYNDLGVRSISFSYPHKTLEYSVENDFDMNLYVDVMIKLYKFAKKRKIYIDQIGKIINSIVLRKPIYFSCKVGFSQRTFYPNGLETQCTKLDTKKSFSLNSFCDNIPIFNKKCIECKAKLLCGGGCPWDAAVDSNYLGVDPRHCLYKQKIVEYIVDDMEKTLSKAQGPLDAINLLNDIYGKMGNFNLKAEETLCQ